MKYPINEVYPVRFSDTYGEEFTSIHNDGQTLRMVLRGAEFTGRMFDDFELNDIPRTKENENIGESAGKLSLFSLHRGELCGCTIQYDAPLHIVQSANRTQTLANMHVRLELGLPTDRGGLDKEDLVISVSYESNTYHSTGKSGWFEDELLQLQEALPTGDKIKACITCTYSDYSPGGHGLFGCMACFRDNKAKYLSVRTKLDIFRIWDTSSEMVQETYVCPEYSERQPGTGYRG